MNHPPRTNHNFFEIYSIILKYKNSIICWLDTEESASYDSFSYMLSVGIRNASASSQPIIFICTLNGISHQKVPVAGNSAIKIEKFIGILRIVLKRCIVAFHIRLI